MFVNLIIKAKKKLFFTVLVLGFSLLETNTAFCTELSSPPSASPHPRKLGHKVVAHKRTKGVKGVTAAEPSKPGRSSEQKLDPTTKALRKAMMAIRVDTFKKLKKLGFSLVEIRKIFAGIKPLLEMLEAFKKNPTPELAREILKSKHYLDIKTFVEVQCIDKKFPVAVSLPFGEWVGVAYLLLQSILDQVDHALEASEVDQALAASQADDASDVGQGTPPADGTISTDQEALPTGAPMVKKDEGAENNKEETKKKRKKRKKIAIDTKN
jgi:hypothetical protein